MKTQSGKAFALTLIAAFSWAVSIITTKIALNSGENPYLFTLWSTIIAIPLWIPIFIKKRNKLKELKRSYLIFFIVIGIGKAIISLTENLALKYTTAINYAFLIRTIILFTIVFAAIFFKEKITIKKIILAICIIIGGFLLTTNGKNITFQKGDILTLIEAATIALINNILLKKIVTIMDIELATIGSFLFGSVFLTASTITQTPFRLPQRFDLIFISVLFGTVILSLTRNRAYTMASASFVTMVISFTPVFVSLMSFMFLKESFSTIQIIGGILIVSTGFLAQILKI